MGIKLRFLCRRLYVSKEENECFDKFTTFPDASDLYLSAFVTVRCSLKVFTLFLVRISVPLTDRCWFAYGLRRQRKFGCLLARDVLPYSKYVWVALAYYVLFGFVSTILFDSLDLQFLYLYLLMFALLLKGLLFAISRSGVVHELDVVIPTFS